MSQLGTKVCDRITGFAGIVTGRCEYISGCTQLLLVPAVDKDGKAQEPQWFDEQRVVRLDDTRVVLDNTKTPGCDRQAPKR